MSITTEADIFKLSRFIMSWSANDPFYYGWGFKFNIALMLFTSIVFTCLVWKTLMQIGEELDILATSVISFTVYYQVMNYGVIVLKIQVLLLVACLENDPFVVLQKTDREDYKEI